MKGLLATIFLLTLVNFNTSLAQSGEIFEIEENHKVFYRYSPAEDGKPTLVLLNGLIYAVEYWNAYYQLLVEDGYGVLQTAYSTQPESLRALNTSPFFAEMEVTLQGPKQIGVETQTFIDETMLLIDALGIDRFSLLSLSYGSIVASEMAVQEKDRINELILMAPAVVASNRYIPLGKIRHDAYALQRNMGLPIDYIYDAELYTVMSTVVSPLQYSYDGVQFIDFFNGVFQMARSSKWFDLKDYASADLPNTFLFVASKEESSLAGDQLAFWELMRSNPARQGLVIFEGAPHAIPGVAPAQAYEMTVKALNGKINEGVETIEVDSPDTSLSKEFSGFSRD